MDVIATEFVRVEDEERMRFIRHIFRDRRKLWLIIAALGGVVAVTGWMTQEMIVFSIGCGGVFAGLADVYFVEHWARKMLRDPQNKLIQQRSRGIYTAEKVTIEGEDGSVATYPWASFVKIEKLGEDYLLYMVKQNALIIFRRNQTEEQWAMFSEWAEVRRKALMTQAKG
jgi:hypothetical protein